MKRSVLPAALVLMATFGGPGLGITIADESQDVTPHPFLDRIMQFDRDGDKQLSEDELPERLLAMLSRADQNEDGNLSREELIAHLRNQAANAGRPGVGERSNALSDRRDEESSEDDRSAARDANSRFGRDGRDQFARAAVAPVLLMRVLDADRDGRLSANEINNATAALKQLDRNQDGQVDEQELRPDWSRPEGPAAEHMAKQEQRPTDSERRPEAVGGRMADFLLQRFDQNKDDRLSDDELPDPLKERFGGMDRNNDGWIDRSEIEGREREMQQRRRRSESSERRRDGPPNADAFGGFNPGGDVPRRPPVEDDEDDPAANDEEQ